MSYIKDLYDPKEYRLLCFERDLKTRFSECRRMQSYVWCGVCVVVAVVMAGVVPVGGEMFTALVHMEGLMDLEMELLGSLNSYITAEKQR